MKHSFIMAVLTSAALGFGAGAQAQTPTEAQVGNGLLVIKGSGGRGGRIDCSLVREGGDTLRKKVAVRGKTATIAVREVVSGSCSYEAPSRGDALRVTFRDENFQEKCPLERSGELCDAEFAVGTQGEFSF